MLDIPSREHLAELTAAAARIIPTVSVGFVRGLDDGRASVLYSHPHGISRYFLGPSELPDVLWPPSGELRHADAKAIGTNPRGAIEWQLIAAGISDVVSLPLPRVEPTTRFWIGSSRAAAPAAAERSALEQLADACAELLNAQVSTDRAGEDLRRLEMAAGLIPALLTVLDVREVFDRLSTISQSALPHDLLTLGLFSEDLATLTMYARTGAGSDTGRVFRNPIP